MGNSPKTSGAPETRLLRLPVATPLPGSRLGKRVRLQRCRFGKHDAARFVKVSRKNVQYVDQPAAKRSIFLCACADSPIYYGMFRSRQRACQPANSLGGNPAASRNLLCIKTGNCLLQRLNPGNVLCQPAKLYQLFREQSMRHAKEQKYISAGTNKNMLVSHVRCFRASRIDNNQPPSAGAQGFGFVTEIRHCPKAPVRDHGIRTQHQQKVCALNVRHRNREKIAEHQPAGKMLGHLVQR